MVRSRATGKENRQADGMSLAAMRCEYSKQGLRRADLDPDPFRQFERWFTQAVESGIREPNAMSLATVNSSMQPALRTVLLKFFDHQGFVFFTNYQSRKAQHMAANPQVAILFPWVELGRQVQIQGTAEKISTRESVNYFLTRPRGAQLGAWVSQQSAVIASRQILEMKFAELKKKFSRDKIPLPRNWGGYRIRPLGFEFWQGRENRLHDRFYYSLDHDDSWQIQRLAP